MTTTDLHPLKSLNLPIVVPKELDGLSLKQVLPLPDQDSGDGYRIEWTAPVGSLTLHAASGGIGDLPPGQERVAFKSPTFGECTVMVEGSDLVTGWMSEMESGLPAYSLVGKGVSREQFLQVAKSLDYIKL
jgi:hypothetical protein